jgi:outer membrane protein, multidrug efflux system
MKKIIFLSIIIGVLMSSCLVGPKYSRPEMNAPQTWLDTTVKVDTVDSIANLKWFAIFKDTVLNNLIHDALTYNKDMANAALRIEQARAAYGISKAGLLPTVGYSGNAAINSASSNKFEVIATASWEIDFWGKLRHAKRASYDDILSSEEGMKAITTTLISDVANLYFQMRDLDNRLAIANRTVESRTEYFNLTEARFKGGDVAELDMLQADQQLSLAQATIQNLKRQLGNTERSLNILLGQSPKAIARGLENVDQKDIPPIPVGLPSSLLEQRPDLRKAELDLQAQTEKIGVAQAMRFPTINLTGFLGFASGDITNLVSDASFVSNATAGILGPIFAWGANKRRVDVQRQQTEILANNYAQTYISALGEVENALVGIETLTLEYQARKHQADAASKALMLSQERYRNGYTDYLEVLVAETSMFDSELQASVTKAQELSAYIYLYRALGGGW